MPGEGNITNLTIRRWQNRPGIAASIGIDPGKSLVSRPKRNTLSIRRPRKSSLNRAIVSNLRQPAMIDLVHPQVESGLCKDAHGQASAIGRKTGFAVSVGLLAHRLDLPRCIQPQQARISADGLDA